MSEASQLVRSYSIELGNTLPSDAPANDVRRIFVENERQLGHEEARISEWRTYYEPWNPVDDNS